MQDLYYVDAIVKEHKQNGYQVLENIPIRFYIPCHKRNAQDYLTGNQYQELKSQSSLIMNCFDRFLNELISEDDVKGVIEILEASQLYHSIKKTKIVLVDDSEPIDKRYWKKDLSTMHIGGNRDRWIYASLDGEPDLIGYIDYNQAAIKGIFVLTDSNGTKRRVIDGVFQTIIESVNADGIPLMFSKN